MTSADRRMKVKSVIDVLIDHITIIMAVIMIAYAVVGALHYYESKGIVFSALVFIFPTVMGILILLDQHRSVFFAVGMYAIAMGFSRIMRYGPNLFRTDTAMEMAMYCLSVVLVAMAINLIYSGYRYLKGNSRVITYIIIGVLFFVFVQLAEMIYGLRVCPDTETFLRDYGVVLVTTLMYLLYIALVWSEKVRNSTNLERMNRAYSGQRIFEGSGPDVSVDMSTAKDIIGFFDGTLDESKFTGLRDKVVYCEFIFPFNDGLQPAKGILQRWHGPNGPVYLNTVQHTEGSLIDLKVFAIDEIVRFKNTLIVHFQGRGAGLFRVREPDEDDGPMHRGQKEYSWRDEE